MTDVLNRTEDLVVNGLSVRKLCRDMSWSVDFELIDAERPFGPDEVPVAVREVHSGGVVYGFIVSLGLPDKVGYVAVSEVDGDENWHQVGDRIVPDEAGDLNEALDSAGRDVIADSLFRGHMAKSS